MDCASTLYGFRVVKNDNLAETGVEKRSFRERLFARPWRPMQKFKTVITGPGNYVLDENNQVIYASGWAIDILMKELEAKDGD